MIYIIDNGWDMPEQETYLLEVTDGEAEIFGDALWPMIKAGWSNDFVVGSTAYINWYGGNKSEKLETLRDRVSLRRCFMQQSNASLKRSEAIPALTDAAIDSLIQWYLPKKNTFHHYIGQKLHNFSWDEVRSALKEKPQ